VLSVALGGCFAASAKTTGTARPSNQPYTDVAVKSVQNLPQREPHCEGGVCTEFYHVQVYGSENATRIEGPEKSRFVCSKPWQFSIVAANQSILYDPSRYTFAWNDVNTIITENVWGSTVGADGVTEGCPTSYGLRAMAKAPYPSFNRPIGSYGATRFTVYRDGLIAFEDKYFVGIGEKVVVSYARQRISGDTTYLVKGGFEVVNLGPWAKDHVHPAASGPVTRGPG
jgi:hypothetical protein